ncbi:uncharacterized protein BO80DRAFT_442772 [Aspergillus ibericus CBS 121593]|uniref:Uncharacterized protein n=1 Tax=Aspergillus ibericus CBS 121593 TaxID=1448316 RepID=A0A395H9T2_9EURO|nr:hypothetical protein BO80DRAFT_442772 [Aspergillus ibericus CBS 121593]RAL03658.1 hypothetical protein BO80DRAFT_442772 [Aspergillus ibericus CBS 121593]
MSRSSIPLLTASGSLEYIGAQTLPEVYFLLQPKASIPIRAKMCTAIDICYSCGCTKEMDFVQCKGRQGTNVRCKPVKKELGKLSTNYCRRHLVPPEASKTYVEEDEDEIEDDEARDDPEVATE